jgi:hypothetical protein
MTEWYYAHNQQQKGPVSWDELRQLASAGRLTRQDMVWSDGMPDWKTAGAVDGLFAEAAAISASPRRGSRVQTFAEEPPDVEEDRPRRKRRKRRDGMSPGALAGIIGGCVGGGLLLLIIVIVLIVRSGGRQHEAAPAAAGGEGPGAYTVFLREDQQDVRTFNFQAGQTVSITVSTRGNLLVNPDVDLEVTRAGDGNFFMLDDAISKDCFITFVAPAADQYTVVVDNLGPGSATSTVNITVRGIQK